MANKNFTDFTLKTPASGDFLVGYSADGSAEYKTTVNRLLSSYATNVALNAASSVLLRTSVYQNASGSFATNTSLNYVSSVLLPVSIYNSTSGTFATTTALNAASSVLLRTSIYSAASGNWQNTYNLVNANSSNWQSSYEYVNQNYENWDGVYTQVLNLSSNWNVDLTPYVTRSFTDSKYLPLSTTSVFYSNLTATNALITNLTATNLTNIQTINLSLTSLSANISDFFVTSKCGLSSTPTARTLADRFGEVYNVKDFGAKGDGISDDAPAIRAAIRAAEFSPLSAATVYFPTGTYNLTSIDLETAAYWPSIKMTSLPAPYISLSGLQLKTYKAQTQRIFTIGGYYYGGVHRATRGMYDNYNKLIDLKFIGDNATLKSGLWIGGDKGNWLSVGGTSGAVRGIRLKLNFSGGGSNPTHAEGYAKISTLWNGPLSGVVLTNGGSGYTSAPTITLNPEENIDPIIGVSQVQGVGATFQAYLNTINGTVSSIVLTNAGSGYNVGAPILRWFEINSLANITFDGLKFISTFGGEGERPIRYDINSRIPAVTALRYQDSGQTGLPGERGWGDVYCSMGATWCITYWGGVPPDYVNPAAGIRGLELGNLTINNCEFRDFIQCADIAACNDAIVTNNKMYWTYAVGSAGGRLDFYSGITGPRYAGKNLVFENNIIDGSLEMDQTQVISQNPDPYFNIVVCPDNGIIVPSAQAVKIHDNIIKHMGFEFIGPLTNFGSDTYALNTEDPVGPMSICNNLLVGDFPKGYNCLETAGGSYGIRQADRSNLLIDGNHIHNVGAPIIVGNYKTSTTNHPLTSIEIGKGCFITNNVITQDYRPFLNTRYIPASADWRGGISVVTTEDTVIANNYVRYNTYTYLGDNWDGRSTTWSSARKIFPTPLVIGGSNQTQILVKDNTFITGPTENPNGKSIAVETDAKVIFKNNTFKGFDILLGRSGGGGGPLYFENTTFDGERYLTDSYNDVSFDRQIFSFYPQTTGWHLVNAGGRRVGSVDVQIQTNGEAFYGDTSNYEMPYWKNQDTKLKLAWAGFWNNPTNNFTVNQTHHVSTSAFPITKTAFNLSYAPYFYFYVDKLTEKLALNIVGANGAKAEGYVNVDKGQLTTVVITSAGNSRFDSVTNPPQITIKKGADGNQEYINRWKIKGSGATFSSTVVNGLVTDITVTNSGKGYQQPIYISFEDQSYSYAEGKGINGTYTVVDILTSTPVNEGDLNTVVLNLQQGSKSITQLGYNGAGTVQRFGTGTPTISSNGGTLNVKPEFIGQEFLDTSNNKWYKAKGFSSSADWLPLN